MPPAAGTDTDHLLEALDGFRRTIEATCEPAASGTDPEALHDLRVAVRRTRSALAHSGGVFPAKRRRRFRRMFAGLQAATSPARDLYVWMASLPADDPLRFVLAGHYDRASVAATSTLSSRRTRVALARWHCELAESERGRTVVRAADVIAEQRHRVLQTAAVGAAAPSEELHRVRKRVKELRYVVELFDGTGAPDRRPLKRLQDALGEVQDVAFQRRWLCEHAAEVGNVDVRLKELDERELAARALYAKRYAAFLDHPTPT